jgi:hypothetical protein
MLLKVLAGIVATIILGAIGSGLWERILAPVLDWCFRSVVDIISTISTTYKDNIYSAASLGFHELYALKSYVVITSFILLFLLLFAAVSLLRVTGDFDSVYAKYKEKFCWTFVITVITFSLFSFVATARDEAVNNTATYAIHSINILRPRIGEQMYIEMLSDFYQIRTAQQFYTFNKILIQQSRLHGLTLRKFEPL